jgi:putative ABC transport system permease protein
VRLVLASVRRRVGSFVGTFLTVFLAVALLSGSGLPLFSVLTAGPGVDRFAAVDAVVAVPRSVSITTSAGKGDKVKSKTKSERLTGAPPLPVGLVDVVSHTPGVIGAVADSAFPVGLGHASVVAHGWASAALTPYTLRAGAPPGSGQVAVDSALGFRVGQVVRLTSRTGVRELRVSGLVSGRVPGQVFVADSQVKALSGLAGPTAVGVRVASDHAIAALRARVGSAAVYTGDDRVFGDLPGAVPDYVGSVSIFGFVLGITGFAAVFVLTGTVSLGVRQRLRELALLRTTGATPGQLRRMLGAETAVVALLAALPALPVGIVVAHLIASRFRTLGAVPAQFTVAVNPFVLFAAVVAGLAVALLATAVVARRGVRIAPAQALREAVVAPRPRWLPRVVVACVLAGGAVAVLSIVPLGGPYGMGMGFISCALLLCAAAALGPVLIGSRAGVVIPLTLMFALNATMLFNGDILTSVTAAQQAARTAPATSTVTVGLPLATAQQMTRHATGSAMTISTRIVVDENGKPKDFPAQGLTTTGQSALDLGVTQGNLTGDAISAPLAQQQHWQIGDRPTVWLADGTRTTLTVTGIFQRWRGFGDLVLPADLVARHDPVGLVDTVYLRGGGPAVASAVHPDVPNQQAAWELMVAISLGFTAIAVANTFAIATSARRREFTTLRLAGATPGQVHRLLDHEALVAVTVALGLGCVISGVVVSAFSLAQDGRWRLFADPLHYAVMVVGVGLLGLVAAAVPARLILRRRSLPGSLG